MGAQNTPKKILLDGELLDPVEWLRRTGVTQPPLDMAPKELVYLGHRYVRDDDE